ncbi:type III PLP-dependent enzyme [Actinocrispum wychmicini]|uniref:Diaminopimelate decarboxylase n=1 Tax=Actinocrispum wychmicini TaxID=1213861 RepID=A0A4R2JUJ4_9PSEU|nr:type III PLP-dependent enzyme [Actinocrispum wychmicini]TCO60699.1 diaminopimelate decarboxylase [Actinocrispum wychmicini]
MFETPAYVYDLDELRRSHALLRQALPSPSELFYSFKANPHPLVVSTLRDAGCRAEVCSPGELATALEAGFPVEDILYTGPGKRDRDVVDAVKAGVTWFSVDSPHGLAQVRRLAGSLVRCLLRVNDTTPAPGQGLTMTGVASQFGADLDWILAAPKLFQDIAGLHLYMGTNVSEEDSLVAQFEQSIRTARRVADRVGTDLEVLDLGGGFAAPFARAGTLPTYPTLAERVAAILDREFPGWRAGSPRIAFESGRYLTATCGTLVTRALDVKMSQDTHIYVLESGINHLGGMSGLRRLPPVVPTLLSDRPSVTPAIVAGPLCTPLDTWGRGVTAPDVRPGDLVRVPNVGAYGLSASLLAFLGHPAPVEVVVDGGRIAHTSRLTLHRTPLSAEQE